jgi:heat shock protein HslJ
VIRTSKILATVLLFAAPLFALVGCSSDTGSSDTGSLDGTEWRLTEWTLSSLDPADFTITAGFAEGRVSGNSGVNTYSGSYQVGPDDAFSVVQIAATEMGGPEPAMRAESAYLTLLGQAKSFKVANSRLTLYDQGGNESLLFDAAGE